MYSDRDLNTYNSTFWQLYMIFGLGCIIFFFIGVCALLCCCRHRVRMERKGYVIRDADQGAPLIVPSTAPGSILVSPPGFVPGPSTPYPTQFPGCPPVAPPAYELPPKY